MAKLVVRFDLKMVRFKYIRLRNNSRSSDFRTNMRYNRDGNIQQKIILVSLKVSLFSNFTFEYIFFYTNIVIQF